MGYFILWGEHPRVVGATHEDMECSRTAVGVTRKAIGFTGLPTREAVRPVDFSSEKSAAAIRNIIIPEDIDCSGTLGYFLGLLLGHGLFTSVLAKDPLSQLEIPLNKNALAKVPKKTLARANI